MREIELTKGYKAIVDDEDFDFINTWKWCCQILPHNVYAKRTLKAILMHREIMKFHNPGVHIPCVDHVNHNGLDNRKSNLRICSYRQNTGNMRKREGVSSKYKGVHFEYQTKLWRASFTRGKGVSPEKSPRFIKEEDAAIWYNEKAKAYWGEFALLNIL